MKTSDLLSRSYFMKTVAGAMLASPFIAKNLHAAEPSKVLRHASFGASGQAWNDLEAIMSNPFVELVAVADVDLSKVAKVKQMYPNARIYQDYRQLLDKEGNNIDSVNVSVPDHMHAPIAYAAMQLGKHVYCEKPLAHDIYETRILANYAKEKKVITQMGIQIHSMKVYRQAVAIVRSGVIGKVKEVHTWSNKTWGARGAPPVSHAPIPSDLNWDLWLGTAQDRPYIPKYYHPGDWRRSLDFGTGTFGDMGCHIFDPVFSALALTSPLTVRSEGPAPDKWNWATNAVVKYVFPGTPFTADSTVAVTWYDGDQRPSKDIQDLIVSRKPKAQVSSVGAKTKPHSERELSQGSIIIGTAGVLHVPHVASPMLFPENKFSDYKLPEIKGTHHWSDWAEAIVGLPGKPEASFDYSGPLTEAVLLGSVAVRYPHTTLNWNSSALRFDNEIQANAFLRRTYRKGWEVAGL